MNNQSPQPQQTKNYQQSDLTGFTAGPRLLIIGLKLSWHPELRAFVILPFILNLFFIIGLIAGVWYYFHGWDTHMLPSWLSWMSDWMLGIVRAIIGLVLIILGGISYFLFFHIIAAPFHSLLAERVLSLVNLKQPNIKWHDWPKLVTHSCLRELSKIAYFVLFSCLLLIISLIPVLNFLTPLLACTWGAWVLAIEYSDYAAGAEQKSFATLRLQLKKHPLATLSFGFSVAACLLIPLLNLVVLPAAVIGGTLLWGNAGKQLIFND